MRSRISIRGSVRPSVRPSVRRSVRPSVGPSVRRSVRPSVGPSVGPSHTSWISEKWAEFEQNSIRNKKVCHLEDDSKTSTRAVSQNASVVRTLFDLFYTCLDGLQKRWIYTNISYYLSDRGFHFWFWLIIFQNKNDSSWMFRRIAVRATILY